MQDNFGHREKVKRMQRAVALQKEGKPLHDIARLLDIHEATVKNYLEEHQKKETKKGNASSLTPFMNKKTTIETLFSSHLQEGFQCVRCKRYAKREAGIIWKNNLFMCRGCYLGLTREEVAHSFGH